MTAPLSLAQNQGQTQAHTGIYSNVRDNISPRGAQTVPQDGPAYIGNEGEYEWQYWPAAVSGMTNFAADSTQTGSNVQTVEDMSFAKVGGGAAKAKIPPYGGTAAY